MELWKIILLIIASGIILSNFVDIPYLASKLLNRTRQTPTLDKRTDFLEVVNLWYQLKTKCEEHQLEVASTKLDEVFPLLNQVIEGSDAKTV